VSGAARQPERSGPESSGSSPRRKTSAGRTSKAASKRTKKVREQTAELRSPPGAARKARRDLPDVVGAFSEADLKELYRFWSGQRAPKNPADPADARRKVLEWMSDPAIVEARVGSLGKRLATILDLCLEAPRYQRCVRELESARPLAYLSEYDLETSLGALERHALLVQGESARVESFGARCYAIPDDVGDAILRPADVTPGSPR
jgi:hypothetical protein